MFNALQSGFVAPLVQQYCPRPPLVQQSGGTPPFGQAGRGWGLYSGFVVLGRVVGTVSWGSTSVAPSVVGLDSEHVGLLAPLVQQYFPFPPLVQPYE